MKKWFKNIFIGSLALVYLASCSEDEKSTAKLTVALIDAPAEYDSVLIDVEDVLINAGESEEEGGWQSIENAEPGIYDLLKLTNGEEAILGDFEIPEGAIGQIRLVLGDGNQLGVDGQVVDLTVPSGSQSGLKINVSGDVVVGVTYKLIIDFDAAKSIVKAGNSGKYNLKPVIRAELDAQTGSIAGVISPIDADAVVYAIQNDDSISTFADEEGAFLIRALEEGVYDVVAVPAAETALDTVNVEAVEVIIGASTQIDTLYLSN